MPLTDHAALTLTYVPLTSQKFLPPPAPVGYNADPKHHEAWCNAFNAALNPLQVPNISASAGAELASAHYPTPQAEANACGVTDPAISSPLIATLDLLNTLLNTLRLFNDAIAQANCLTLKTQCPHKPHGVQWWNEDCMASHVAAHSAPDGEP